jgi:hypothetical protein
MPLKRYRWLRAHWRPVDLLLLAGLLVLSLPLWWGWLFPPPPAPFAYGADPFPVSPAVLHAGDTPDLEVTRCNATGADLTYAVTRLVQRVDTGEQWALPTIGAVVPAGCVTVHSKAHTLPPDLPPGRYRLLFVASIVTREGSFAVAGRTADFDVVNGVGGGR